MSEYADDILIDHLDLERELIRQPILYLKYSELAVDANFEKDRAKELLRTVESEIDLDIRQNWDDFGFDSKPTEGGIRACITQQPKYISTLDEYMNAVKTYNSLTGAKVALEHKKKSLELLVSLLIRGYSAEPRVDPKFKNKLQEGTHHDLANKLAENERLRKRN
jgi:hypothetical protein